MHLRQHPDSPSQERHLIGENSGRFLQRQSLPFPLSASSTAYPHRSSIYPEPSTSGSRFGRPYKDASSYSPATSRPQGAEFLGTPRSPASSGSRNHHGRGRSIDRDWNFSFLNRCKEMLSPKGNLLAKTSAGVPRQPIQEILDHSTAWTRHPRRVRRLLSDLSTLALHSVAPSTMHLLSSATTLIESG